MLYADIFIENNQIRIHVACNVPLILKAHYFCGRGGYHFDRIQKGDPGFSCGNANQSVCSCYTASKRTSIHQLTNFVFNDIFGILHESVLIIGAGKREAICYKSYPFCAFDLIYGKRRIRKLFA